MGLCKFVCETFIARVIDKSLTLYAFLWSHKAFMSRRCALHVASHAHYAIKHVKCVPFVVHYSNKH